MTALLPVVATVPASPPASPTNPATPVDQRARRPDLRSHVHTHTARPTNSHVEPRPRNRRVLPYAPDILGHENVST